MSSINKAIIIGNICRDPELKTLPSGKSVCTLSVATNETWLKDGQKQERVEFHNVQVWGKQAESCEKYLSKGRKVYVEGKITTESYEKDGVKRYTTKIQAKEVLFLGGNSDTNKALQSAESKAQDFNVSTDASFASDDIPF